MALAEADQPDLTNPPEGGSHEESCLALNTEATAKRSIITGISRQFSPIVCALATLIAITTINVTAARSIEVLRSTGGVPPHIVGRFRDPASFQMAASGELFVFDRRDHAVYGLDAAMTTAQKLVQIGNERGRLLDPSVFDLDPRGGTFVVADAPGGRERIQIYVFDGSPRGAFSLPGRATPRITMDNMVISGVGSLQYTGRSIVISAPELGTLITECGLSGTPVRPIGALRPTGQEANGPVHLGLNAGLPLVNAKGEIYFVFQAGTPLFRKYDARGQFLFERHIEGAELDPIVAGLPESWPIRKTGDVQFPLIPPNIRTAALDQAGNLWISLVQPYTYVYDPDGEKMRVVQFRGAGIISPTSLFFASPRRLLVTPGCYEFDPT